MKKLKFKNIDVFCLVVVLGIVLTAAIVAAATSKTNPNTANFIASFPTVATSMFGVLVLIIGFFLIRTLNSFDSAIQSVKIDLEKSNKALENTVDKLENTMLTLFNRDREAGKEIAHIQAEIENLEKMCKTHRSNCLFLQGIGNRRSNDPGRRKDNGYETDE